MEGGVGGSSTMLGRWGARQQPHGGLRKAQAGEPTFAARKRQAVPGGSAPGLGVTWSKSLFSGSRFHHH